MINRLKINIIYISTKKIMKQQKKNTLNDKMYRIKEVTNKQ